MHSSHRLRLSTYVVLSLLIGSINGFAQEPNGLNQEPPSLEEVKRQAAKRSGYHQQITPPEVISAPTANLKTFRDEIGPLLSRACVACHGEDVQEANLRIDTLDPNLITGPDAAWWLEVMNVLSNAEMPPKDGGVELADTDRTKIIDWLSNELRVASQVARGTQQHSSFRRLTRYEYNYAMQDLLGLPYDFASDLPPETPSEEGFQNSAEMLRMSAPQLVMYRELARKALRKATVRGERPEPVYYAMTMDRVANIMQGIRSEADRQKSGKRLGKFNAGRPHFVDRETGLGVDGRYSYGGARYSWRPVNELPKTPEPSSVVFVLPARNRQIFDLGDHLPDTGTLRLRLRANRTSAEAKSPTDLRISFGFQASNNSQAAFRVGDDLTIDANPGEPTFYTFDIPLGEVPRNPYRGVMKLGRTPNPSEYLVFHNLGTDSKHDRIQIDHIEITAPLYNQWPPASHRGIFFESDNEQNEVVYAREVLTKFLRRAWRRPATDAEVQRKLALFTKIRPVCDDFQEAMIEVLASVLASPRFLYVTVGQDAENGAANETRLGDFELATRLSLFLWCSIPDEELLRVAESGELQNDQVLLAQTERMLADPKADRFANHFVRQWLGMQLLDYLQVDAKAHRGFDPSLKEAMQREPIAMFEHMLDENLSILDFLHADYALLNERLARHYRIPDVHGSEFRRVELSPAHRRGGLLTTGGLLAMNSDGKDSHPLKRGIWLLEKLLHDPPPPPPPAVPEIDLTDPDILKLTLKERMEDHRSDPACMSCHSRIDPWGVAFENFDAIGTYRDRIGKKPVDATSTLFNGQRLDGIDGLKRYLLEHRQDQFARATTHKLMSFALGRSLGFADRAEIEQLTARLRQRDDGLKTLTTLIITSDLFRSR